MPDNFAESLFIVREIYHEKYPGEPEDAEGWLYNNILSYMNDYLPSHNGFTPKFHEFINRGEPTKIKRIDTYLDFLDNMSCESAILKLWDKMTQEERNSFMKIEDKRR